MKGNFERKHPDSWFLQLGIIGLGESAQRVLLPGITKLPGIRLAACCDLDSEKRHLVASRWDIPNAYADPQVMLSKENLDIVVISAPPQEHHALTTMALEAGCHVYCEKPFMLSLEAADQVIALANEKGLCIDVNSQYYQMPIFRAAKEYLESGQVGRLYHVEMWQHMFVLPDHESGWKAALHPRRTLLEFGTHAIDLMCKFFDAYPEAVTSRIANADPGSRSDLCILLRLDFPDGRVGNLMFNRMSYAARKYLEVRLDCERAALRASYGGIAQFGIGWNSELGRPRMRFSLTKGGEVRLEQGGKSRRLSSQSATAISDAAKDHFTNFLSAVKSGASSDTSIVHAREVLKVLFAGYESAEKNGELVWM